MADRSTQIDRRIIRDRPFIWTGGSWQTIELTADGKGYHDRQEDLDGQDAHDRQEDSKCQENYERQEHSEEQEYHHDIQRIIMTGRYSDGQ